MEVDTQSQLALVEVHVAAAEEVTSKAGGGHEFGDHKSLVLVTMKERLEVVIPENGVTLSAMKLEDQVEIGKCHAMLHSMAAVSGDGDDDGNAHVADDLKLNIGTLFSASQGDLIAELPSKEVVAPGLVVEKVEQGCDVGGGGCDGKVVASNEVFLPVPEGDDVRDDVSVEAILPPRPARPAPECVEVDDVVQTMRNILFNLTYADDDHLSPEDEAKVRDLLEYHPKAQEKTGSGIDFIKVKRHSTFKDARCFWVVRTDGTETDFSYHKCLKEKVARENSSFLDRYDAIYQPSKRPRMA